MDQPGDEAVVTIYLSEPAPFGAVWYKFDPVNKIWQDYSEYTEFSDDRKSVYLTLLDGGFGDADGIENSIIIDPLTLGVPSSTSAATALSPVSGGGSGSSSAGCFISTANHNLTTKEPLYIWKKMQGIELAMMFLLPFLIVYLRKLLSADSQSLTFRKSLAHRNDTDPPALPERLAMAGWVVHRLIIAAWRLLRFLRIRWPIF